MLRLVDDKSNTSDMMYKNYVFIVCDWSFHFTVVVVTLGVTFKG